MQLAGIELGGTKCVAVIGTAQGEILQRLVVKTTTPAETMPQLIGFFKSFEFAAMGVASFGPIDKNPGSETYGYITATTKLPWKYFDIIGALRQQFQVPMGFDTDVNAAALAEHQLGHGQDCHSFLYLTIGTGIGGGAIVNNALLHGMSHPEMGHVAVARSHLERDDFVSVCPYHDCCLEGVASGPAMKQRWGVSSAMELPAAHVAWQLEADYIAMGLFTYMVTLAPQRILIGGGVTKQQALLPLVRARLLHYNNGYLEMQRFGDLDHYIMAPKLGQDAGVVGALVLAAQVL